MTTPALRRLRSSFPAARITLLATTRTTGLFEASDLLDEVIIYQRREEGVRAFIKVARTLRERRFDLALLFQNAFEAALLAWLGGARFRIGFAAQGRSALLTHALKRGPQHRHRHQVYDYLDIVAASEQAAFGHSAALETHDRQSAPALAHCQRQSPSSSGSIVSALRPQTKRASAHRAQRRRHQQPAPNAGPKTASPRSPMR